MGGQRNGTLDGTVGWYRCKAPRVPSLVTIDPRNRHERGLELAWTLQTRGNSEMPLFAPQKPAARNRSIGPKRASRPHAYTRRDNSP